MAAFSFEKKSFAILDLLLRSRARRHRKKRTMKRKGAAEFSTALQSY